MSNNMTLLETLGILSSDIVYRQGEAIADYVQTKKKRPSKEKKKARKRQKTSRRKNRKD